MILHVELEGGADLAEVAQAGGSAGGFFGATEGGQEQRGEHANDRDDYQYFDQGEGEKADFRAALDYMSGHYPGRPLWAAGFSFGAGVALEVGALDDRVSVLIGIAPPVASSTSGMVYEFGATLESEKPKFLIQGEADELCPLEGLWRFYSRLKEPRELVVIDAADHLFEGKTQEVGEALEDLLEGF